MACGGIAFVNDKEGMAWIKISKKCLNHSFTWARTIHEAFGMMIKSVDVKVSTYVLDKFCKGERLARFIGLKRTNETEEYNGNMYYRYTVI